MKRIRVTDKMVGRRREKRQIRKMTSHRNTEEKCTLLHVKTLENEKKIWRINVCSVF